MRYRSIELALFELELAGIISDLDPGVKRIDQYGLLAMAFKRSAGDNAFELLRRYKTTSEHSYHRALQALEQIQKSRPAKPPEPQPEIPATVPTRDPAPPTQETAEEAEERVRQPLILVPNHQNPSDPDPDRVDDPQCNMK